LRSIEIADKSGVIECTMFS